ncbi:MAG: helix-turn-helix transcriptional regulator, partial [Proteobacteria bacterium]|nr:helix-turn-helix transcriptional regulator [Candidatus Avisuccinivibrio stercorigallinarum]
ILHYSYGGQDKRFNRIVVYFREGALPPELFRRICQHHGVFAIENKEERAQLTMLLHALLKEEERTDSMHQLAKQDILELIVILLLRLTASRVEPVNTGKIRKIVRYLNDHYADEINLDDLAAHFFISKYHLCREFKKYTQNTIVEYLNFVRIIHAQRLFMESSDNISEIAQAVGFSSLTHFERVFSKITGQRPNERRREILKNKESSRKSAATATGQSQDEQEVKTCN